jgi:transposase
MEDTKFYSEILGIKLPWSIDKVVLDKKNNRVDIYIIHEPDIQVRCPECKRFYSVYDHSPERIYRHMDTCQMSTYIHVRLPRVNCPKHGVKQIVSQFGENGSDMTYAFENRVIEVAQVCDIQATSRLCRLSWDRSWNAVGRAVQRGFSRKEKRIPPRIGVDEKSFAKGHKYETLVYDLDRSTVEYVCDYRNQESLESYYQQFNKQDLEKVKAVAMDMWDPYIAATKNYIPDAASKIVYDRYHIMKQVMDAVDKVRKQEHKLLLESNNDILKGTRYLWLWSHENIPEWRREEFEHLRNSDLKVCRAWALKENLRHMWKYRSKGWMRRYFNSWYKWAVHSQLKPMVKAAKTLKRHLDNIVTYATHHITNALGESLNGKIEKVKRMAFGFRNREHYRMSIYFHCGGLELCPIKPNFTSLRYKSCF